MALVTLSSSTCGDCRGRLPGALCLSPSLSLFLTVPTPARPTPHPPRWQPEAETRTRGGNSSLFCCGHPTYSARQYEPQCTDCLAGGGASTCAQRWVALPFVHPTSPPCVCLLLVPSSRPSLRLLGWWDPRFPWAWERGEACSYLTPVLPHHTPEPDTHVPLVSALCTPCVAARRARGAAVAPITPWTSWRRPGCMVRAGGGDRGASDPAYARASLGAAFYLSVVVAVGSWVAAPRRACGRPSLWGTVTPPPP